jgi:hypothetical protein
MMAKSPALTMPEPAKVEALAGYGLSVTQIAKVLRVDADLLTEACAYELETGLLKANAKVAENLYRKATGDGRESVTAAIFWLKTRAAWKETNIHEHVAAPPEEITINHTLEFIRNCLDSHEQANGREAS